MHGTTVVSTCSPATVCAVLGCAGTSLLSSCRTLSWAARWWTANTSSSHHSQVSEATHVLRCSHSYRGPNSALEWTWHTVRGMLVSVCD